MRYVANFLAATLLGWPSAILAYCFAAVRSGFSLGLWLHEQHESEILDKRDKLVRQQGEVETRRAAKTDEDTGEVRNG